MDRRHFSKTAAGVAAAAALLVTAQAHAEVKVIGSGASFPFPIYSAWFQDFSQKTDGVTVDYQSKGSGAGIQDLINGNVQFAASDAAMNEEEIDQLRKARDTGAVILPMTAGEIVLAFNLPGIEVVNLPRSVYPEIFAGNVTKWNDPAIAEANPDVELPDLAITPIVRSDSSGTTYVFTRHLSAVDPESFPFDTFVSKAPEWPGSPTAAPKNDGITALLQQTPGGIGYIEYGYAKLTNTPVAALENAAGEFVVPTPETGAATLASAEFPSEVAEGEEWKSLIAWLDDPQGEDVYPIATFTWMLFYEEQDDEVAAALREVVEYGLTTGQEMATDLGYIPMPEEVVAKVREEAQRIQ